MANYYVGDLLPTIGMSGHSRVRTELFQLTVVPVLPPHPVQVHRQLSSHCHLRDLPPAPRFDYKTFPLHIIDNGHTIMINYTDRVRVLQT